MQQIATMKTYGIASKPEIATMAHFVFHDFPELGWALLMLHSTLLEVVTREVTRQYFSPKC